mgnify:FL=1
MSTVFLGNDAIIRIWNENTGDVILSDFRFVQNWTLTKTFENTEIPELDKDFFENEIVNERSVFTIGSLAYLTVDEYKKLAGDETASVKNAKFKIEVAFVEREKDDDLFCITLNSCIPSGNWAFSGSDNNIANQSYEWKVKSYKLEKNWPSYLTG